MLRTRQFSLAFLLTEFAIVAAAMGFSRAAFLANDGESDAWLFWGLLAFTCWGAAIGGLFGKARNGGILAFAFGILSGLFLPAVNRSGPSPRLATQMTFRNFDLAINSYKDNAGELPPDLEALLQPPRNLPQDTNWGGPYLSYEQLPLDPWRGKFHYEVLDPETGKYRLWSNGPDRRPHTEDDISAR